MRNIKTLAANGASLATSPDRLHIVDWNMEKLDRSWSPHEVFGDEFPVTPPADRRRGAVRAKFLIEIDVTAVVD
jgi:hypothetical protein